MEGVKVLINIRKAIIKDIDNLIAFLSAKGFKDKDIYNQNDYYVYYDNDILLGCGTSFNEGEYCIIENIIVDKKFRKNKVGTAIAKTILNSYECNGAKYALSYGGCQGFCESLGFSPMSKDGLPAYIKNVLSKVEDMRPLYMVSLEDYFKNCC